MIEREAPIYWRTGCTYITHATGKAGKVLLRVYREL